MTTANFMSVIDEDVALNLEVQRAHWEVFFEKNRLICDVYEVAIP